MAYTEADREYQRAWRERNRELKRARDRARYAARTPEQRARALEQARAWRARNREAERQCSAAKYRAAQARIGRTVIRRDVWEGVRRLSGWSRVEVCRALKAEAHRTAMLAHDAWLESLDACPETE